MEHVNFMSNVYRISATETMKQLPRLVNFKLVERPFSHAGPTHLRPT